jgi:hypothetical protein
VINDDPAKIAPYNLAWDSVPEYLRNAKLAPLNTIPARARISGMKSVVVAAANVRGKPVHHMTRMYINQTWLASHTGPMLWSTSSRISAPRSALPAVKS